MLQVSEIRPAAVGARIASTPAAMRLSLTLFTVIALLGCGAPQAGFDDHTVPALDSREAFDRFAVGAHGRLETKFIITGFGSEQATLRFTDGHFFTLHDEWYWFRLLNGQHIPSREGIAPVLVTSAYVRPYVRSVVERLRRDTPVLSQHEISPRIRLKPYGSL